MAITLETYSYEAFDIDGNRKKGKMDALSEAAVVDVLRAEGLVPVAVNVYKKHWANINITTPKEDKPLKLDPDQEVTFARQLYMMTRAGLSLSSGLRTLGEDHPDIRFTEMMNALSDRVLAGVPLSAAMEDYEAAFDDVFRSYVAAGEITGNLEGSLQRLSRMLDKSNQLRLKVKSVTAYPKMVAYAIAVMVMGIMMFLVPAFGNIYHDLGAELPLPTRLLVAAGSIASPIHVEVTASPPFLWTQSNHTFPITTPLNLMSPTLWAIAAVFGYKKWRKANIDNIELGMKLDKLKYRTPVFGNLWKAQALYRWSSTLAGALSSGLQSPVALELAGRTAGSFWIRHVTEELIESVRLGRPLSSCLQNHKDLFDPQIRALAATGEDAGEPAEMFENVALTLEDELDAMVAVLGAKIEVLLLMVMGAVVGGLVVVLYMPIFNLSNAAMGGLG